MLSIHWTGTEFNVLYVGDSMWDVQDEMSKTKSSFFIPKSIFKTFRCSDPSTETVLLLFKIFI